MATSNMACCLVEPSGKLIVPFRSFRQLRTHKFNERDHTGSRQINYLRHKEESDHECRAEDTTTAGNFVNPSGRLIFLKTLFLMSAISVVENACHDENERYSCCLRLIADEKNITSLHEFLRISTSLHEFHEFLNTALGAMVFDNVLRGRRPFLVVLRSVELPLLFY
jgi:hypothetical protein